MTFKVIDRKTGKEPTSRVIGNIARKGYLMAMDIDQFFVGEDGSLVLADDCGNIAYCDTEKFEVIAEQEPQTDILDKIRAEIEETVLESLSDCGDDWFTAEKVNECLDIIDKYRQEGI